jgi:cell division protein ZapA
MTDDHKKTVEKQLQDNQVEKARAQKSVSNNANMPTNTQSNAARPDAKVTSAPEPQIKKVDIAIAGVTYPIYCPVHEQEELHAAV